MKKTLALILALVLALALIGGCGTGGGTDAPAGEPAGEPAPTEPAEPTPETRTVVDMSGTEVEIPYEVDTYVESWYAHDAVDVMLDQAEGMLVTPCDPETYAWMYEVCPNMNNALYAEFSTEMNLEEIIALEPDVVFGSKEDYREMFETVGIPYVNCMFSNYDEMRESIALTAEVLGGDAPAIAEKYFTYLDEKIAWVDSITSTVPENERKYIAHGSSVYNMGIDGVNTIIDNWITLAGGINVASKEIDGNLKEFNMEQMLAWDPDVIITGGDNQEVADILADPAWQSLKAVQNGDVYSNPRGIFPWDRYGVEEALQFQWAAMLLYPDLFEGYDINAELRNFYKEFLNYDLTEEQANLILNHLGPNDTLPEG